MEVMRRLGVIAVRSVLIAALWLGVLNGAAPDQARPAEVETCQGPYKGRTLAAGELEAVLLAHRR